MREYENRGGEIEKAAVSVTGAAPRYSNTTVEPGDFVRKIWIAA